MTRPQGTFGAVATLATAVGLLGVAGMLFWPEPPVEPGGTPTQALLALGPLVRSTLFLVAMALIGLVAGTIGLVRREPRMVAVAAVTLVDAVILGGAALVALR